MILELALISDILHGRWHCLFLISALDWGGAGLELLYPAGQRTKLGVLPPTKYVQSNYSFRNPGNDSPVGPLE